jgi:hypothetical protein
MLSRTQTSGQQCERRLSAVEPFFRRLRELAPTAEIVVDLPYRDGMSVEDRLMSPVVELASPTSTPSTCNRILASIRLGAPRRAQRVIPTTRLPHRQYEPPA